MPKVEKELVIRSKQGLHARPAALFVQITEKYDSSINVEKDGQTVNGKSIMGMLMLGAQQESTIKLIVDGHDAEQMIKELEEFIAHEG